MCWWLTAEAGGFAERISQPKITGQKGVRKGSDPLKGGGKAKKRTLSASVKRGYVACDFTKYLPRVS